MPIEATAEAHQASGVTPNAPWRVKILRVLPGHRLAVTFRDGTDGIVDFSAIMTSQQCGIYEALKDPAFFEQARLELGAVTWPNGADLDPAWMHEELNKSKPWSVPI
jgi:hypothetical protein